MSRIVRLALLIAASTCYHRVHEQSPEQQTRACPHPARDGRTHRQPETEAHREAYVRQLLEKALRAEERKAKR